MLGFEQFEDLTRCGGDRGRDEVGDRDGTEASEPIDIRAGSLRDDTERLTVLDHHDRAVSTLGKQRQRIGDGVVRTQRDRRIGDEVAALDERHGLGDSFGGDVLRNDDQSAAAGDSLRHAAAGDCGHIGDHDGNGRSGSVGRIEIDVEPRGDLGPVRDEEDVVVGQVVWGALPFEELHVSRAYRRFRRSALGIARL